MYENILWRKTACPLIWRKRKHSNASGIFSMLQISRLEEQPLRAATILRGKHRPEFTPHVDCGEFVIIVNCDKAVLTGNKINQKLYRTYSGYIGGLKETSYKKLMAERPEFAMKIAVKGMLPKNSIGDKSLTVCAFTAEANMASRHRNLYRMKFEHNV